MSAHSTVTLNGVEIAYNEYGRRGETPLLYFHGWPGSRLQAALAHTPAEQLGIHVVAPDRPGMGRSPFQPDRQLIDWPPLVARLADHLGWDRFGLLGVSGGGPYALACAALIPQRLEQVVICSGVPHPDWLRESDSARRVMRLAVALEDRLPGSLLVLLYAARAALRLLPGAGFFRIALPFLAEPDRHALQDSGTLEAIAYSIKESFRGSARGVYHDFKLLTSDWGINMSGITIPVHFSHGALDSVCPTDELRPVVERNPRFNLIVMEGEGHYSLPIRHVRMLLNDIQR